jgi:hypothetical protein
MSAPQTSLSPVEDHRRNPFSTKMVRPGSIAYRLPAGWTISRLADQLDSSDWWGQVVGPHGTGKSTLLVELLTELRIRGRDCVSIQGSQSRRWPRREAAAWNRKTQVVVDGFEQLCLPSQIWLMWRCQRGGAGLLVTTHRPVALPVLWKSGVSDALACELVNELTAEHPGVIEPDEVAAALSLHGGNLREVFFDLYDRFEERVG